MIGCYSAEIINKITIEISKSLNNYLLNEFNNVLDISAKSIRELLAVLQELANQKDSYSSKVFSSVVKTKIKSTAMQTEPYIISITPVVSVGIQAVQTRPNSKSVVVSNNFKVKTEASAEPNFLTDREF